MIPRRTRAQEHGRIHRGLIADDALQAVQQFAQERGLARVPAPGGLRIKGLVDFVLDRGIEREQMQLAVA